MYMYTYMNIYCIYVCVYTYVYIYIYTYKHTYIHIGLASAPLWPTSPGLINMSIIIIIACIINTISLLIMTTNIV